MKKIIITGGNGFIGKELIKIINKKNYVIYVLDKNIKNNKKFNNTIFLKIDITNSILLNKIVKKIKPDFFIHLAAIHHIPTCEKQRQLTQKVNIIGTENILHSLERFPPKKFIFASSGAVYDWGKGLLDEKKTKIKPKDNYSLTKYANEVQLKLWMNKNKKTKVFLARIFNTIGPNDPNSHLIPDIIKQLDFKRKKHLVLLGNTRSKRDYIDVRDTAKYLSLMIEKKSISKIEILNVCSQVDYSVRDIVKAISKVLKNKIDIKIDANKIRKIDRLSQIGSNKKIKTLLNYKPRYKLEDSIKNILKNFIK